MIRTIRRFFGSGRRTLVLAGALPAVAAVALLTAPAASAQSSLAPAAKVGTAPAKVVRTTQAKPSVVQPDSYSSCPASYLCFWVDANWSGDMGKLSGTNAYWGDFSQSACQTGNWNDCASALYNNGTSDQALVYENSNWGGGYACVARGTTMYADLAGYHYANNSDGMNDSISSNKWTTNACT